MSEDVLSTGRWVPNVLWNILFSYSALKIEILMILGKADEYLQDGTVK
jgi:hypothetical protein